MLVLAIRFRMCTGAWNRTLGISMAIWLWCLCLRKHCGGRRVRLDMACAFVDTAWLDQQLHVRACGERAMEKTAARSFRASPDGLGTTFLVPIGLSPGRSLRPIIIAPPTGPATDGQLNFNFEMSLPWA